MKPMTSGTTTARPPGMSISRSAAAVEMSTHLAYSGTRRLALAQARDLAELAAHLFDHLVGGPTDGVDGERGEQERQHGAEEQADEHLDLADVEVEHAALGQQRGLERLEQRQRGEGGRADGEALGDGGGGVAERVEAVGDLADLGSRCAISAMPPALSAIGP
jgi:hypothetical protein